MSVDGLRKAASSVDRLPPTSANRRQPPLASSDSGVSLIRTPRDCGSSTAHSPEKSSRFSRTLEPLTADNFLSRRTKIIFLISRQAVESARLTHRVSYGNGRHF